MSEQLPMLTRHYTGFINNEFNIHALELYLEDYSNTDDERRKQAIISAVNTNLELLSFQTRQEMINRLGPEHRRIYDNMLE